MRSSCPKVSYRRHISKKVAIYLFRLDLDDVKDFNENMSMQSPIEDFDWADDIMQQDDCQYREPGRLATLHETLMSPSRKNPEKNSESYRELIESRQKEAQQRREEIQREKVQLRLFNLSFIILLDRKS